MKRVIASANSLLEYIPREYRSEVLDIYKGDRVWNDYTKRWNTTIVVEWSDGETSEYQNASYMKAKLSEFGRE